MEILQKEVDTQVIAAVVVEGVRTIFKYVIPWISPALKFVFSSKTLNLDDFIRYHWKSVAFFTKQSGEKNPRPIECSPFQWIDYFFAVWIKDVVFDERQHF